jgi:hypothetical protein
MGETSTDLSLRVASLRWCNVWLLHGVKVALFQVDQDLRPSIQVSDAEPVWLIWC